MPGGTHKNQRADLDAGLRLADEGGFTFAAKIVRGAYVVAETLRAKQLQTTSPLHPTKAGTDTAYDDAVEMLLGRLGTTKSSSSSAATAAAASARTCLVVATHNQLSVQRAVDAMKAAGVREGDPRVQFAQASTRPTHDSGSRAHHVTLWHSGWPSVAAMLFCTRVVSHAVRRAAVLRPLLRCRLRSLLRRSKYRRVFR